MFNILANMPDDLLGGALYIVTKYWPLLWNGVKYTLLIAFVGTLVGLVIGLFIGGIRAIKISETDKPLVKIGKKLLYFITSVYIEVFRGTPMMVQAAFIYYTFKQTFNWTALVAGMVVVSINTGAYMAEIIRSGIQSVPKGQNEAALALGMNNIKTMMFIILPQAIRNAFPSIGNEFVVNIKDSCVLNIISVTELFFQTSSVGGTLMRIEDAYLVAAVIYFILTFTTTRILAVIEKKLNMPVSKGVSSQTVPTNLS
ncbi:MAG: amino acid ABC transporter permease [Erysipelotrichaceae bacterium]